MAKIRHKINGGLAEVSDEYAEKLIEKGLWASADDPAPAPRPRRGRPPKKTVSEPVEATIPEE